MIRDGNGDIVQGREAPQRWRRTWPAFGRVHRGKQPDAAIHSMPV
jgi:hypothetical protein